MRKFGLFLLWFLGFFVTSFAQTVPNPANWYAMDQEGFPSNSELECYKFAQSTVSGGTLVLTAAVQSVTCNQYGAAGGIVSHSYASGEVYSVPVFLYGTFVYRAKFAGGAGPWPAIWMEGWTCHPQMPGEPGLNCNWPNPGANELDLTEVQSGAGTQPFQNSFDSSTAVESTCRPTVTDVTANYHIYTFTWTPTSITWLVDGSQTCQFTTSTLIPKQPMMLIMNVAVGGSLGGTVNNGTLPQSTTVDYMRVTQNGVTVFDDEFSGAIIPPAPALPAVLKLAQLSISTPPPGFGFGLVPLGVVRDSEDDLP